MDTAINKLKRQGRIIWIAKGDSGVYYYFNGRFGWVKPGEETGLLGNHINDIEVDYANDISCIWHPLQRVSFHMTEV